MRNEAEFKKWMKAVDKAVSAIAGIGVYDLPDAPFSDWFEDEMSASEAAHELLEAEGFPF